MFVVFFKRSNLIKYVLVYLYFQNLRVQFISSFCLNKMFYSLLMTCMIFLQKKEA